MAVHIVELNDNLDPMRTGRILRRPLRGNRF
jgi:hypothetical protein